MIDRSIFTFSFAHLIAWSQLRPYDRFWSRYRDNFPVTMKRQWRMTAPVSLYWPKYPWIIAWPAQAQDYPRPTVQVVLTGPWWGNHCPRGGIDIIVQHLMVQAWYRLYLFIRGTDSILAPVCFLVPQLLLKYCDCLPSYSKLVFVIFFDHHNFQIILGKVEFFIFLSEF